MPKRSRVSTPRSFMHSAVQRLQHTSAAGLELRAQLLRCGDICRVLCRWCWSTVARGAGSARRGSGLISSWLSRAYLGCSDWHFPPCWDFPSAACVFVYTSARSVRDKAGVASPLRKLAAYRSSPAGEWAVGLVAEVSRRENGGKRSNGGVYSVKVGAAVKRLLFRVRAKSCLCLSCAAKPPLTRRY